MTRKQGVYYNSNNATHKTCPICGIRKERSEFHKWKARTDGLAAYCKPCFLEKNKNWAGNNQDKLKISIKKTRLKITYGISLEDRENMMKNQDFKCKICKISLKNYSAIDHDHKTGKIRGLLCRKCNLGLGGFKDNVISMENAIKYLEKYENL